MAPVNTPGRKKRENNFFDIGVQGRKTGITLQDNGIRDENGIEPLDGIFSSPEKSPPKRSSSRKTGGTVTSSESMDVQESSMPEPTETLHAQQLHRSSKTMLPPPLARSPIKTALGSSPRRQSSMGPRSQARMSTDTPDHAASYPAVSRRLDFSAKEQDTSIFQATPASVIGAGARLRGKARADVYDLEVSPVRGQKRTYDESIVEDETFANGDSETHVNGVHEDGLLPPAQDESLQSIQGYDDTEAGTYNDESMALTQATPPPAKRSRRSQMRDQVDSSQVEEPLPPAKKTRRVMKHKGRGGTRPGSGRKAKDLREDLVASASIAQKSSPSLQAKKKEPVKRGGRSKKKQPEPVAEFEEPAEEDSALAEEPAEDEHVIQEETKPAPLNRKGRGRLAAKTVKVHKDGPSNDKGEPAFKVPKKPGRKPKATAPPTERDPNVIIRSIRDSSHTIVDATGLPFPRSPSKAVSEVGSVTSTMSRVGRSLQILRQGTPMDDEGVRTTRSGRSSVKPVDWWKNERIKYDYLGNKEAVVRAEDVVKEQRAPRKTSKRKRGMSIVREEEEEEELEEWEENPGFVVGHVNRWDETIGVASRDEEEQEIAWSNSKIDVREVQGGNFGYGKVVSNDFFGAGLVDLPAGGFKRLKNSRRMQMVFCVLSGGVEVVVGESKFTIHNGGIWQVPRGNSYSIENKSQKPARIFFAQGCEVLAPTE
ncbi:hypothetical protein K432DRAFT_386757 [Lepidopterella palustris CBS 459.81]|uniref:CENP-C homolog n=1 Tax=Lepidopterella palustris CBS 459.81 TaxID=1314670 RepID=A0A8E2DZB9_9PEZI|nr:hypothetical protein K432DRAFT_386757 [Lepidopterella palustris CBS 459.81]